MMKLISSFLLTTLFAASAFAMDCEIKHYLLSNGSDRPHSEFLIDGVETYKNYHIAPSYDLRVTESKVEIHHNKTKDDENMVVFTDGNQIAITTDIKHKGENVILSVRCPR